MAEVRFRSTCPVCKNPDYYYYWIHADCGGDLYLNSDAELTCDECYDSDYVFRWKFDCGRHYDEHEGGFQYGSLQGFYACLYNLSKIQNPPHNFIIDVINALYKHRDEIEEY